MGSPFPLVVSCDPGLDGALALVVNGKVADARQMPIIEERGKAKLGFAADGSPEERHGKIRNMVPIEVRSLLLHWRKIHDYAPMIFACEKVWARPGQGASSTAKFMHDTGLVEGIALGLGFRLERTAPNTWKAKMGVTEAKATSIARARELAPEFKELLTAKRNVRTSKQVDGLAEAMLIGLWAAAHY